jgi:hypothetical protein
VQRGVSAKRGRRGVSAKRVERVVISVQRGVSAKRGRRVVSAKRVQRGDNVKNLTAIRRNGNRREKQKIPEERGQREKSHTNKKK